MGVVCEHPSMLFLGKLPQQAKVNFEDTADSALMNETMIKRHTLTSEVYPDAVFQVYLWRQQ